MKKYQQYRSTTSMHPTKPKISWQMRVDPTLLEQVRTMADEEGRSASSLWVEAMRDFINKRRKERSANI